MRGPASLVTRLRRGAPAAELAGTAGELVGTGGDVVVEAPVTAIEDATTRSRGLRFVRRLALGFALGVFVPLAIGAAGLLAYDAAYDHRIVPGVHVGDVDLSGMDVSAATAALQARFGAFGDGRIRIHTAAGDATVEYRAVGRGADVPAMVGDAMQAGRSGTVLERGLSLIRLAVQGRTLEPRVTLDKSALEASILAALSQLQRAPSDARIEMTPNGAVITLAHPGVTFDVSGARQAVLAAILASEPSAEATVDVPAIAVAPAVDDREVTSALAASDRMTVDLTVKYGRRQWTIPAATVRSWIGFGMTAPGVVSPVVDANLIAGSLAMVSKALNVPAVSSSFLTGKSGTIVGVTASQDGQTVDTAATATEIAGALTNRANGLPTALVGAVVTQIPASFTTDEARKTAPLMVVLGTWTTYFPISERNFYGANIWLPARFINGTVLQPGQTFEWWRAIGPVATARGFGLGGLIAGDHTEPTGAMGGGMCSSSTTLFNAALRAGLKMGARDNHRYYINRYPLGLDATVSNSQTMSFTNDMPTPILIRGYKIVGSGGRGYVRYEIWGIPDGRRVSISRAAVSNLQIAHTYTYSVSTLPHGVRKQTEYPANGMDVAVTRVVRDRNGNVIHSEVFRSHYQLWNGKILVGR